MNIPETFQHNLLPVALVVLAVIFSFWALQKLIKWTIILLIVGYLIWHFWLS